MIPVATTVSTRRFPGRAPSLLPVTGQHVAAPVRDRIIIAVCMLALTALAWRYLVGVEREMSAMVEHDRMMAEMGMTMDMAWGPREVLFTFIMWAVMMVGMMAPSAAPTFILFAALQQARGAGHRFYWIPFGAGYFVVWTVFSGAAALLQWRLHEAAVLSAAMVTASAQLGGAILIGAGLYQFAPLKSACLTHCRSPLGFIMSHWRDGVAGALRMGLRHGGYCVGCCWALMAVLFAVGVMNLLWVAALSIVVLAEKLIPRGEWVARAGGAAMIGAGMLRVFAG